MRHTKAKEVKEKTKICQNHEGSCIFGYRFRKPKKVVNLQYRKKAQHLGTFGVGHREANIH